MNWIIYLQRISELFKWRWLYLITLHAMWWDAALDSFSLSTFDWILCSLILETILTLDFLLAIDISKFMLLFHVVTWLSKINVKCQRQQWGVSLYQINHHYVRKMEQKRLSVNSWTSKIWVMASKMLGNNASWQLVTPWFRTPIFQRCSFKGNNNIKMVLLTMIPQHNISFISGLWNIHWFLEFHLLWGICIESAFSCADIGEGQILCEANLLLTILIRVTASDTS